MNFVYFSPNFPEYGWKFCHFLKENGVTVLGIGDSPYDALLPELKDALTEYYVVDNLADYDQVYRAVACLTAHHGKIDRLYSNNEFWLVTEAKLRTDFNIQGVKYPEILTHKQKSLMKRFYAKAGVPVAEWCLPKTYDEGKAFTDKHGYPVVVKPDDGVGACDTYTLFNDADLAHFFDVKPPVQYIMEEFVNGHVETFDGVTDANGDICFCASQIYHQSLMDTVVNDDCIMYHSEVNMAPDIKKAGEAVVKAYGIKDTFFHFEFFRTAPATPRGKGKIVGLEVNMRPPGGMITEIYEASHDVNIYKLWADVLVKGEAGQDVSQKRFAGYASRKNRFNYVYSHDEILQKYGDHIMEYLFVEGVTARAMGDIVYLLYADTKEELMRMIDDVNARN